MLSIFTDLEKSGNITHKTEKFTLKLFAMSSFVSPNGLGTSSAPPNEGYRLEGFMLEKFDNNKVIYKSEDTLHPWDKDKTPIAGDPKDGFGKEEENNTRELGHFDDNEAYVLFDIDKIESTESKPEEIGELGDGVGHIPSDDDNNNLTSEELLLNLDLGTPEDM